MFFFLADASLQFLQAHFGCECVHCGVVLSLAQRGLKAELPLDPLLYQPRCAAG